MTITLTVTPQTSVEQLANFLNKSQPEDMVFQRKETQFGPGGGHIKVTILYLGKNRRGSDVSQPGHNYSDGGNLRRQTARDTIADILQNTTNKVTARKDNCGLQHDAFKNDVNKLLTGVIEAKVRGAKNTDKTNITIKPLEARAAYDVVKATQTIVKRSEWIAENLAKFPEVPELPETKTRVLEDEGAMLWVAQEEDRYMKSFPDIEIDGIKCVAKKVLGTGTSGIAVKYEDTTTRKIQKLVKFPWSFEETKVEAQELEVQQEKATRERVAGAKYNDPTHHVMGFTDHVRMANGTLALIGNLGTHGDVFDFADKMHKAKISAHAHRLVTLTMTQDIAKGVASIHKKGGIHGDMKPDNQVIDAQGRVHLIDLGHTAAGPSISVLNGQPHAWNAPRYNASEAQALYSSRDKDQDSAKAASKKTTATISKELRELRGPNFKKTYAITKFFRAHAELFTDAAFAEKSDDFAIDAKADVFGIGQSTFFLTNAFWPSDNRNAVARQELFPGRKESLSDNEFANVEDLATARKVEQADDPNSHGVSYVEGDPFKNHALVEATGDPVIDLLLDGLLAPNPENRIDDEGVEFHPTMYYAANGNKNAVGSDEVRDLIVAIARDNPEAIAAAMAAVEKEFPEPENLSEFETAWENRADAHLGAKAAA